MKDEDKKDAVEQVQKTVALLASGNQTAQRINDVLQEADDLRATNVELMILGSIIYAAGYARADDLDLDGFLQLCAAAYGSVELVKQDKKLILGPRGN